MADADDQVFIEDTTIASLVKTRLEHPEYYVVSANIINQPSLSWVHQHLDAVRPYLPEHKSFWGREDSTVAPDEDSTTPNLRDDSESPRLDWRASVLPKWSGSNSFTALDYKETKTPHRWLPLHINHDDPSSYFTTLERTPIMATEYDAFGPALNHWTVAAQQHYSFFEHLENNELWRYKFHIWDYFYDRMGIQFIAMMGRDINLGKPMTMQDDEQYLSEIMTKKLKRHAVIDGRGLAAHYSFGGQRGGMASTDVLERYRSFAEENICLSKSI
jgi:hypothetical protein